MPAPIFSGEWTVHTDRVSSQRSLLTWCPSLCLRIWFLQDQDSYIAHCCLWTMRSGLNLWRNHLILLGTGKTKVWFQLIFLGVLLLLPERLYSYWRQVRNLPRELFLQLEHQCLCVRSWLLLRGGGNQKIASLVLWLRQLSHLQPCLHLCILWTHLEQRSQSNSDPLQQLWLFGTKHKRSEREQRVWPWETTQ